MLKITPDRLQNLNPLVPVKDKTHTYRPSGAQPEMFQGRGSFVKLGHFDKLFVKNFGEKPSHGEIVEVFFLDTLKTKF